MGSHPPAPFTAREFFRILDMMPEKYRPYFITLAITSLPATTVCALTVEQLDHDLCAIRPGTPGTSSELDQILVPKGLWGWIVAAVPAFVSDRYYRDMWQGAVERAGLEGYRVADLRRLARDLIAEARAMESESQPRLRLVATGSREDQIASSVQAGLEELAAAFPSLALTPSESRRLILRQVPG